jgi:hypothetical protein
MNRCVVIMNTLDEGNFNKIALGTAVGTTLGLGGIELLGKYIQKKNMKKLDKLIHTDKSFDKEKPLSKKFLDKSKPLVNNWKKGDKIRPSSIIKNKYNTQKDRYDKDFDKYVSEF